MRKLFYNVLALIRHFGAEVKNLKKEQDLDALIQPIRKWLAANPKRNALVILSEPRATTHLVLATNTTGDDMVPDMGMIVGMEPQLNDVIGLILGMAMDIEPVTDQAPDWEDTIDYTASSSGRPDPSSSQSRSIVGPLSEDK